MIKPCLAGLVTCFVAALPFFRNGLERNLGVTLLLFGGFAGLKRRFTASREPGLAQSFAAG